ncbi:tetratricopeptide repeat protein [Psychromonas sp. psych-6C06]|uniref:tetratricopeptide repeat protein n=1 Tax=Psychromonas sp. psych-6C06 TaxID=2058089 RepID=UPI00187C3A4A|nr:tetratricopeptide repeat protein [Psychromonas sp. psych-6C06]
MSIINKMHQGLKENQDTSPMLLSMPPKKQKKRVLLFVLISLLLASSIGLSYLVYDKSKHPEATSEKVNVLLESNVQAVSETSSAAIITFSPTPVIEVTVQPAMKPVIVQQSLPKVTATAIPIKKISKVSVTSTPIPIQPTPVVTTMPQQEIVPVSVKTGSHLKITKSKLTAEELADIHLKSAEKALSVGDTQLAAQEKHKALNVQPNLHDIRQSLALYYYGIGEQEQAKNLLKRGAREFPEHADFNLMLSRIALKNGDQQKAFLYLQQSPPEVQGNLDYHVSYAILAQKFKNYELAETLYKGLISQRPNNGRWIMSLAIAQDKQGKQTAAIANYQKALLQIDLSSKAKQYINQRLTYLASQ